MTFEININNSIVSLLRIVFPANRKQIICNNRKPNMGVQDKLTYFKGHFDAYLMSCEIFLPF